MMKQKCSLRQVNLLLFYLHLFYGCILIFYHIITKKSHEENSSIKNYPVIDNYCNGFKVIIFYDGNGK